MIIHGNNRTRTNVMYENVETYMNKQVIFATKGEISDLYIESGETNYPFELQLPNNLPTSFQHQFGRIRYHARGTIDIPWFLYFLIY